MKKANLDAGPDFLAQSSNLNKVNWQGLFFEILSSGGPRTLLDLLHRIRKPEQIMGALLGFYDFFGLSDTQLSCVLKRYEVFSKPPDFLKLHLTCLLDLECAESGAVQSICNRKKVFFPEDYPYSLLLKALLEEEDAEEFDLHIGFPMWVSNEERTGQAEESPLGKKRAKVAPPREGNFERRGSVKPLRIREARSLTELLTICSEAKGKVRKLVFNGHANPYMFGINNLGEIDSREALNGPLIHSEKANVIWQALSAKENSALCYFACEVGVENGLGYDSARRSGVPVLASDDEVSALTLDFNWEEERRAYGQFWVKSGKQFSPVRTVLIQV